ncbi:MAG: hypothetical protein ACQESE_01355 [Nanobdellota archaeon]
MAGTVLGNTMEFLAHIGIYDIVLPFLLVFTLMFAFLEKTRVLGVEVISDKSGNEHTFTRKNLNSIVAFTAAFFVVASSQLVRIISEVLANTIILVVAGLCFMLASGVIYNGEGPMTLSGKWEKGYKIFSLVGIVLILFNALGWLDKIYSFLVSNWSNGHVATIIMIGLFIWFMYWITTPKGSGSGKGSEDSDD